MLEIILGVVFGCVGSVLSIIIHEFGHKKKLIQNKLIILRNKKEIKEQGDLMPKSFLFFGVQWHYSLFKARVVAKRDGSFKNLAIEKQKEIYLVGIKNDLVIFFFVIIIYFFVNYFSIKISWLNIDLMFFVYSLLTIAKTLDNIFGEGGDVSNLASSMSDNGRN